MITIDFETREILQRPHYPPRPVGVSLLHGSKAPRYYAFGHPSCNNCRAEDAHEALVKAWESGESLLFHNAKFDIDVAETWFGLPRLPWSRYHDTMFLLFLRDPHSRSLALKPAAKEILGMEPEEREAVREWLIEHRVCRRNDQKWGRFIAQAPGGLVGAYARGDVVRTYKLFAKVYPEVKRRGMEEAYDRERRLMPILLDNERAGIRVDVAGLRRDLDVYEECIVSADKWLKKRLRCKDLNLDSDGELAEALDKAKIVKEWSTTATGQRSVSKKNLTPTQFSDARVAAALGYRTRLATCLSTFARPWLEMAEGGDGHLHTSWNQTRGAQYGTRTGRPSTSAPNFLNVPKSFMDKDDGYVHPEFLGVKELPLMRRYLLPDEGCVWLHRDYNQQELRIVAHFEDSDLCKAYNENPDLDVHTFVQNQIKAILGIDLHRRFVKNLNFGYIYGMGLGSLSERMAVAYDEAKKLRDAQMSAVPGLASLSKEIKSIANNGLPIRTWGGREYFPEPKKLVGDRIVDFIYKLLNYLVQGSAADATKEAVVRHHDAGGSARFLVTVYDEINVSAAKSKAAREMVLLKDVMEGLELDVPMLSDGKVGANWGDLRKEQAWLRR